VRNGDAARNYTAVGARCDTAATRGSSVHGVPGERASVPTRLVVVHPFQDEEDNCISSAGKNPKP